MIVVKCNKNQTWNLLRISKAIFPEEPLGFISLKATHFMTLCPGKKKKPCHENDRYCWIVRLIKPLTPSRVFVF